MKALTRYVISAVAFCVIIWIFLERKSHNRAINPEASSFLVDLQFETLFERSYEPLKNDSDGQCSMRSCFNFSRCLTNRKVYVYPDFPGAQQSVIYANILKAIRESDLYTDRPEEACLFVLSLDTIDRDRRSENYVADMAAHIAAIPHELWRGGENHIVFNLYHGTFPDYADHDLGFDTGKAIVARASASQQHFRRGFDLSFPLFHKEHPLRNPQNREYSLSSRQEFLVSFKGKRYVYGIGSETRDSLHHLHDGKSIAMVTTCRHNNDWKMHQDDRCELDNARYERWDYQYLLANSTFCLTPRGRRLGSFRFLESLGAGCIPVVLSDDWVLPFAEIIDWNAAAVRISERNVLLTADVLYTFSTKKVDRMRRAARSIYQRYFASVSRIALTAIQIVLSRVDRSKGLATPILPLTLDPLKPDGSIVAVIATAPKTTSKLQKAVDVLSSYPNITKIVILWDRIRGEAPHGADFGTAIEKHFVDVSSGAWCIKCIRNVIPPSSSLLFLDERLAITYANVSLVLKAHYRFPDRIVSTHTFDYVNPSTDPLTFGRVFNVAFPSLVAFHSSILHDISLRLNGTHQCDWMLLSVDLAERSQAPPIRVGERPRERWMRTDYFMECAKQLSAYYPTGLPLPPSDLMFVVD